MQSSCLTVVLRRAGEIAAWCAHRGRHDDPAQSLRTQALRPSHLLTTPLERRLEAARRRRDYTQHEFLHVGAERDAIIDVVSRKRAEFLRAEGHYPSEMSCDLAGGRLLMSEDSSVWDGASQAESKGFFDEDDRPPWDTWLCYVQGADYPIAAVPPKGNPTIIPAWKIWYLVSWAPPTLLDLAVAGMSVNPVDCIQWADDVDIPFTRELRAAGVLKASS